MTLQLKPGDVYRRTGPSLFGNVQTGDLVIVIDKTDERFRTELWVGLLVPRLGRVVYLSTVNRVNFTTH